MKNRRRSNISDGVFVLNYLFSGEGLAPPCLDAADAGDAGQVTITSGVFVLNYLFSGGSPPPPPPGVEECGPDPTEDELDCAEYENC